MIRRRAQATVSGGSTVPREAPGVTGNGRGRAAARQGVPRTEWPVAEALALTGP